MIDWLDPILLSRIQFAFVISFHIIFPAFTIGLASWLFVLETLWLKYNHQIYKELYEQWVKIFAVTFGMGVVSGIVMSYQFGTNWSQFSHKIGNVIGPILSFEVLTAFFLESSFLGIMLFGWSKVGKRMHYISTIMVALGTLLSAFWILSANSWMNTPTGFKVDNNGLMYATSWLEVIFNPSFPYRFFHMTIAAYLTTAFAVGGISAWYLLKKKHVHHARIAFAMAIFMAAVVTPIQILVGHAHGANTLEHQPAKIAAMEGIWETEKGANLNLFGWPDEKTQTTKYALQIPKGASIILKGDKNAVIKGLKSFPKSERPPVLITFLAFRIMVGLGVLMLLTGLYGAYLFYKKKLFSSSRFHKWCILMAPSGFISVLAGWFTTEVGRQPYTVYGVLKTVDSASNVTHYEVSISLITFMVVYTIMFGASLFYIFKLVRKGPKAGDWHDAYGTHGLKHPTNVGEIFIR